MSGLDKFMAEISSSMDLLIEGRPLPAPLDVDGFPDQYKELALRVNSLGKEIANVNQFVADNSENGWHLHQVLKSINKLSLMVIEAAEDGRIVYANPLAREYLTQRGLTKMPMDNPYRHGALISYLCTYREVNADYVFPVPYELMERDRYYKISTDRAALSDGSTGYIHTIDDISDYRRNERQLWEGVMLDSLTGAYSRFAGMQKLEELLFGRKVNQINCLACLSVDGYGELLERHGQAVAEQALCDMATALRRCLRESDWVVYYGGDEFLLFILDCELVYADRVFQRLNQILDHLNGQGDKPYTLAYHVGVDEIDELRRSGHSTEAVIAQVRELLAEDKKK